MIYGMAYRAWQGIWYGLARYGMVYNIAWRAWHGTYMVWPREIWHGTLYGLASVAWFLIRPGEV